MAVRKAAAKKTPSKAGAAVAAKVTPRTKAPKRKPSPRGKAVPTPQGNQTVRIRKISNGFLVSTSNDGPRGYKETEVFHEKKPKISFT